MFCIWKSSDANSLFFYVIHLFHSDSYRSVYDLTSAYTSWVNLGPESHYTCIVFLSLPPTHPHPTKTSIREFTKQLSYRKIWFLISVFSFFFFKKKPFCHDFTRCNICSFNKCHEANLESGLLGSTKHSAGCFSSIFLALTKE